MSGPRCYECGSFDTDRMVAYDRWRCSTCGNHWPAKRTPAPPRPQPKPPANLGAFVENSQPRGDR